MKKNELAERIFSLQKELNEIEFELEILKGLAKKQGTFSTRDFVVTVDERSRETLPGIPVFKQIFGDKFDKLVKPLVKVSTFKTVSVKRKAA